MTVEQIPDATWLDWMPLNAKATNESVDLWRLDLDLDGSGKKRTVVLNKRVQTFGSGDVHYRDAYLCDSSAAFDKWLDSSWRPDDSIAGMIPYFPGDGIVSSQPFYQLYFGGEHRWFAFNGKYYFLTSEDLTADFTGLAQLLPDGSRKVACVIRAGAPQEIYDKFILRSGLKSDLKVLWTIGHASGGPCGTLRAEVRIDMMIRQEKL